MSLATTIILLSTDEGGYLRRSLPLAMAQEGAEVIVFDNGSSDDTADLAREHGADLRRFAERLAYTQAMNRALTESAGEAVLLLNPDCFLDPDFLRAARPRLEEKAVGSVAPKLIRTVGPEPSQHLDALDAAGMTIDRNRKNGLVGHGRPALGPDLPGEVFGVDGAAALYRRETIEECMVEGEVMDTDFGRWTCDVDLAWRARLLGWRCVYEPRAVAHHIRYFSPSSRADMPVADRREQFRNRYLMMLKNDIAADLRRDLGRILAYELLALAYVLLRERHLLGGYVSAARLAGPALRKRRTIQARRRVATVPLRTC